MLDANALVSFFQDRRGGAKVQELFVLAEKNQASLSISLVNLAEVLYVLARYLTMEKARTAIQEIEDLVKFVAPDKDHVLAVADLRYRYKLGLADCFAAELAMRTGATLVTADPEFSRLGKQLRVMALPRHSA